MTDLISIIIPNYNGSATLQQCLHAAAASSYSNFEIIVVDDCSDDRSIDIINQFPCQLIQLKQHSGAAKARNIGVAHSRGDILFFTDADCLMMKDTLSIVRKALKSTGTDSIIGGTYTRIPFDNTFFSLFQSAFIHHSETQHETRPDYVATHAMAIDARVFRESGGFAEDFMPILEDVEFSHRLRHQGYKLAMDKDLQVQHIFNFSLSGSLINALIKSMYWTLYSIKNGDLLHDSGTASHELKVNVITWFLIALLLLVFALSGNVAVLLTVALLLAVNLIVNKDLLRAFYLAGGTVFAVGATLYYLFLYPIAVGVGAITGAVKYLRECFIRRVTT